MSTEVKMPQLSDTMDAGKILVWNKREGDKVARGDILAEVETDKANLEIESFHEGYLLKIVTPAGDSARVGQAIAIIGQSGESTDNVKTTSPASNGMSIHAVTNHSAQVPKVTEAKSSTVFSATDQERIKASPLAKKIAAQRNVDLFSIQGSGPNGRIVRKDVEQIQSCSSTQMTQPISTVTSNIPPQINTQSSPAIKSAISAELSGSLTPLTKMRATIAKRMQQAVLECPHFYTKMSIDMSAANQLRAAFKQDPELQQITINHMIIKAAAYALKKEPGVNSAFKDEQVFSPNQINIGVITAVEGGLLIPVIRQVDALNLKDLAFDTRSAIERVRAGRPSASDLSGGTFSISNMGMYGVESFTAIISPGQGAILAVGATLDQVVAKNGVMQIAPIMQVTLSVDHRIIDGTMAGQWLTYFKQALETPALLMI